MFPLTYNHEQFKRCFSLKITHKRDRAHKGSIVYVIFQKREVPDSAVPQPNSFPTDISPKGQLPDRIILQSDSFPTKHFFDLAFLD